MAVLLCDVCDEPADGGRPLHRVYDLGWAPLDVHEDCWSDTDADAEPGPVTLAAVRRRLGQGGR